MRILIILGSIIIPILMLYGKKHVPILNTLYHLLALISLLLFGNIASISIYKIIVENRVFMTDIHGIFLNPFFLSAGAYLGVYTLYCLWETMVKGLHHLRNG